MLSSTQEKVEQEVALGHASHATLHFSTQLIESSPLQ